MKELLPLFLRQWPVGPLTFSRQLDELAERPANLAG
jgi:hypothetical protein